MTCGGRIDAAVLIGKQPAELTANSWPTRVCGRIGASSEAPSGSPEPRLPTFPPVDSKLNQLTSVNRPESMSCCMKAGIPSPAFT
jgi:hypothetical protein